MKWLKNIFNFMDGLEIVVFGVLAAVLMISFPVFLIIRIWDERHYFWLGLIICGLVLIIVLFIREFKRKHMGWFSGLIIGIWLLITLYLITVFEGLPL